MYRMQIFVALTTAVLVLVSGLTISLRVSTPSNLSSVSKAKDVGNGQPLWRGVERWLRRQVLGSFCKWLKSVIDYGCDNQLWRDAHKAWNELLYGVTDCSSFCVYEASHPLGGRCTMDGKNYDESTWCGSGGVCDCYDDDDEKAKDMTTTTQPTTTPSTTATPPTTKPSTTTTPTTTAPTTPFTLCLPRVSFKLVFIPGLLGGAIMQPNITCKPYEFPETGPQEPKTGPKKPKTGPQEPKTGPKKPKTGPKKPKTDTKKPKTDSKKPKTDSKKPKTDPKKPKTGLKKG